MADITAAQHQALSAGYNYIPVKTELAPPIYRQAPDWSKLGAGIQNALQTGAEMISKSPLNPAVKAQMLYQAELYKESLANLKSTQGSEERGFRTGYTPAGPTISSPAQSGVAYYMRYGTPNGNTNNDTNQPQTNPDGTINFNPSIVNNPGGGNNPTIPPGTANVGPSNWWDYTNSDITNFAEGGVVTKPTMALIGERGPEQVTPLYPTDNNQQGPPPAPGAPGAQGPQPNAPPPQQPQQPIWNPGMGVNPATPPAAAPTPIPYQPVSPQETAAWQEQHAHPPGGASDVLQFVKSNYTTRAQDATYMPNGGPNGTPAYAIHMKGGSTNIIPLQQLVQHGFGPSVASQNTSAVMSSAAANGMAQPPSGVQMPASGPQGPGGAPGAGGPQPPSGMQMPPSGPQGAPGPGAPGPSGPQVAGQQPGGQTPPIYTPGQGLNPQGPPPAPGPGGTGQIDPRLIAAATNVPNAGGPPVNALTAGNNPAGIPQHPDTDNDNPSNVPRSTISTHENPIPTGENMGHPDDDVTRQYQGAQQRGLDNAPTGPNGTKLVATSPNGYRWYVDTTPGNEDSGIPFLMYKATPWSQFRMPNDGRWTTHETYLPDGALIKNILDRGGPDTTNWSTQDKTNWLRNYQNIANTNPESQDTKDKLSSIMAQGVAAQHMQDDFKYLQPGDWNGIRQIQEAASEHRFDAAGTPADHFVHEAAKWITGGTEHSNPALKDLLKNYEIIQAGMKDPGLTDSERAQASMVDLSDVDNVKRNLDNFATTRKQQYVRYQNNAIANRERISQDWLHIGQDLKPDGTGNFPDTGYERYNPADIVRTQSTDNAKAQAAQNQGATTKQGPPGAVGTIQNPVRVPWGSDQETNVYNNMPYHAIYIGRDGRPKQKMPPQQSPTPAR